MFFLLGIYKKSDDGDKKFESPPPGAFCPVFTLEELRLTMTKRVLFASTMLSCFIGGLSYNALASEPELYFFPKNKWVVENVSHGDSKTLPTCTISNQFNNGYIVQLAGTPKGFTNFNLDLRQDIFQANRKYEVKYSIPGKQAALIPTKAFRNNLLVSDLRNQKDFGDALPVSSVVDLNIRGNEFRLYLTGLESVMGDYRDCLGINVADASTDDKKVIAAKEILAMEPKTAPSATTAPPPPMQLSAAEDKPAPKAETKEEPMPAHKLRPVASAKPRYTEQMEEQLKNESKQYTPDNTDMTPTGAEKMVETVEPEAAVVGEAPQQKISNVTPTPKSNIKVYSEQKNGVVYNVAKTIKPIVADMTTAEVVRPAARPDSVRVAVTNPAPTAQDNVATTLSKIEPASGMPSDDFIMMRDKISELEGQVNILSKKNRLLDEELTLTLKDAQQEQRSVSSNNWNLEAATMKFNEAERQIMRLGRQLKTVRMQCDVEKSQLENMLFDPELTNQQQLTKLSSLEGELDSTKSDLYRQKRQYEERIKILEGRLDAQ